MHRDSRGVCFVASMRAFIAGSAFQLHGARGPRNRLNTSPSPEHPPFALVIGTFASTAYIHLQLEARRRLYPEVPLLVHDDGSPAAPIIMHQHRHLGIKSAACFELEMDVRGRGEGADDESEGWCLRRKRSIQSQMRAEGPVFGVAARRAEGPAM